MYVGYTSAKLSEDKMRPSPTPTRFPCWTVAANGRHRGQGRLPPSLLVTNMRHSDLLFPEPGEGFLAARFPLWSPIPRKWVPSTTPHPPGNLHQAPFPIPGTRFTQERRLVSELEGSLLSREHAPSHWPSQAPRNPSAHHLCWGCLGCGHVQNRNLTFGVPTATWTGQAVKTSS